jgi:hypothetical protein
LRAWILSRKSQIGTVVLSVLLLVAATATTTMVLTRRVPEMVVPAPDDQVRVSVIGDSYSSGFGNNVVWPSLVAAGSQVSVSNAAYPGAGYVGGAGQSGPFAAQIEKALASKPAIIVVFGGMTDALKSDDLITQSAIDLFTELARRAPTVELVVLGPIWHEDPVPETFIRLHADVASAAKTTNTTYIPLIEEKWLVGDGLIQDDNFTPTDEGQSVLARQLGPVLLSYIRKQDRTSLP